MRREKKTKPIAHTFTAQSSNSGLESKQQREETVCIPNNKRIIQREGSREFLLVDSARRQAKRAMCVCILHHESSPVGEGRGLPTLKNSLRLTNRSPGKPSHLGG